MDLSPTAFRKLGIPSDTVLIAGFVICLIVLAALVIWKRHSIGFTIKRLVIVVSFPDAARACRLNVTTQKRKIVDGEQKFVKVEHLPKIKWFGRAMPNNAGVIWKIKPAKGSDFDALASATELLANALEVQQVLIERRSPHNGEMIVIFGDPLSQTVSPYE